MYLSFVATPAYHMLILNLKDDTFATTVVLAYDVPIETLSKMLEHRSIQVAQIYAKMLDQTISRHSDKLF